MRFVVPGVKRQGLGTKGPGTKKTKAHPKGRAFCVLDAFKRLAWAEELRLLLLLLRLLLLLWLLRLLLAWSLALLAATDRQAAASGVAAADGLHIGDRVVGEFPLVIVVLFLVNQDGFPGAGGREADDACAAKGLAALIGAGGGT